VAFVGAGELAEIALLAAREAEIDVVFILDRETNRARMLGLPVVRDAAELAGVDVAVITDSRMPQQSFDGTVALLPAERVLAVPLLRIARAPLSFRPVVR
jgi:predicted short-subunit dehydrogenase-like oxidoreductase (DUF2520 family)